MSRTEIGQGPHVFAAAREVLLNWKQFDLGWVHVSDPSAKPIPGQLVAVEAHTTGLWSINLSRITEVIDTPMRFGFLYTTTSFHVEEGQERFLVEFDHATETVSYLIEAVSRPRHMIARLGYPFTRAMQHRFAKDSHARMNVFRL